MPHPFFECTLVGRRIALPTALEPYIGAYIVCYAGAVNHEQAIAVTAAHLPKIGFAFEGVEGEVRQLNPTQWDRYVGLVWPEYTKLLASQQEVEQLVVEGGFFIGPILTFNHAASGGPSRLLK